MNYKIEVFCDNDQNANTYLVYNDSSCIIIDPANSPKTLKNYIENRKIEGIFLTHGHYDHFRVLSEVLELSDCNVYMHKNAGKKIQDLKSSYAIFFKTSTLPIIDEKRISFVDDGNLVCVGPFSIKCWYTPGHTNCMMSYIIDDNLFSGDFLFKDSIGRTDLDTGSVIRMMQSLKMLKTLKVNYNVYPGHGESTTLNDELKYNHYLKNV